MQIGSERCFHGFTGWSRIIFPHAKFGGSGTISGRHDCRRCKNSNKFAQNLKCRLPKTAGNPSFWQSRRYNCAVLSTLGSFSDWFEALIILLHYRMVGGHGPRATSHTRLRARDHDYASSTLIGGKGAGGKSSLHCALEGPTDPTKLSECKMDVKFTWHQMGHVSWSLGCFSKTTRRPWHSKILQLLTYYISSCEIRARHDWKFIDIAFG